MRARTFLAWVGIGLLGGCGEATSGADPSGPTPNHPPAIQQPGAEVCDGYDNNLDGRVDEGCSCQRGVVGECYPGLPGQDGVGICRKGTYHCEGEVEFTGWSACSGAVTPAAEICGNSVDEDCDGADLPCSVEPPPTSPQPPGGEPPPGSQPPGGDPPPAGQPPGSDPPPSGQPPGGDPPQPPAPPEEPPPPPALKVPLFFIGDCVTASCPATAPYPVGCQVIFSVGDARGCVASTPTSPVVYFQAGDQCDKGLVAGHLLCATKPGLPLSVLNCPMIGKTVFFYPPTPAGCPAVH